MVAATTFLPRATTERLAKEGGVFETASVFFFSLALAILLFQLVRAFSPLRFASAAMLLWAVLRELDFQKRFTYRSVESIGYYSRSHAPWSQKILVLLILAPFVVAGLFLVRELYRRFVPACRERHAWTSNVVGAVLLLLFAGVSEKIFHLPIAEEVFEAGFALLILMLVWESRVRDHLVTAHLGDRG